MLRVLHVIGKMDRAGAETVIMNIYRNIDRERIQFDFMVFSSEEGDYDSEIKQMGGRIYRMPQFKWYNYFELYKKFYSFFKKHPYKIVHGHRGSLAPAYLKAAKDNGAYTIAHSHATNSNRFFEGIAFKVLSYRVRYIADHFFACSRQAGIDRFGKKITESEKFDVLKNGITSDNYKYSEERHQQLKKKYGLDNKLLIGHVGRFSLEKNHRFIIDVFDKIYKEKTDSVLILLGRGKEKKSIEKYVEEKNLNKQVLFWGVRDDIADMMNLFDAFIFPSLYEGLGIVGIEAQAAGLPCFFSENIPQEAIVTNHVWQWNLEWGDEKWAINIMKILNKFQRIDSQKNILDAKYDIKNVAKDLQSFYLKVRNEG